MQNGNEPITADQTTSAGLYMTKLASQGDEKYGMMWCHIPILLSDVHFLVAWAVSNWLKGSRVSYKSAPRRLI